MKLIITGKMGSGKDFAAAYLEHKYGAQIWARTEMMKRLAHAMVDHTAAPDQILEAIFPEPGEREAVRRDLFHYAATYMPEIGKPRRLYQDVTEICQEHDPLCFERELAARIDRARDGSTFCLIDDVRSLAAYEFFVSQGFSSLRINASEELRKQRMLQRDGYLPDEETLVHPSETQLDGVQHTWTILNEGTEEDLYEGLIQVMSELSAA